jgi:D-sedoheptulose 7-phosphate isomerase
MTHVSQYLGEVAQIAAKLDQARVEQLVDQLDGLRERGGRLFILGVGGSAANASHAACDFRKLCGIETYCVTDNTAELTARTNDEGWPTVFAGWLDISRLGADDALLIFSVGGGDAVRNVSPNLVTAIDFAREKGALVLGIVGRDGGYAGRVGDTVVIVPTIDPERVTPHSEAFQAVLWHCLVSHPKLQRRATKW